MPKGKGRQTGLEVLLQKALLLQVFFTCKNALLRGYSWPAGN